MATQRIDLPHLFADHPVRGEQVAFDFKGFAKTLAGLALNPENETPFTVVVRGSWGRGKTTLLRQTERILISHGGSQRDHTRLVKPLWFNAWKCPQEDTVLAGLLGTLLDEFRRGTLLQQAAGFIDQHKEWAVGHFLKKAFPYLFEDGLPADRFAGVAAKRAFYDTFEELFRQLSYVWFHGWAALGDNFGASLDGRTEIVAVFLDDLDRCRPERVLEVLEAINLFLDMPGVCFYLGLDWQRTLDALAEKKKEPARFLEKIVQVAIDLPAVPERGASDYLRGLLPKSPRRELLEKRLAAVGAALESFDPRHVKRFMNDLSIRLSLLENTGRLGEGADQIPARAVVGWHLILEALRDDTRRVALASLSENVTGLLRRYRAWKETPERALEPDAAGEVDRAAVEAKRSPDVGLFEVQTEAFEDLLRLSGIQLDHLVHLGSPPRVETAAHTPSAPSSPDQLRMEWVRLAPGTLQMGSEDGGADEKPVHTVRLSGFEIGAYPVTNSQFAVYVAATGARAPDHWNEQAVPKGLEDHPVVNVSSSDASRFCEWLSKRTGAEVRLPTEAQWEYAARGGAGRIYPWGNERPTNERANFGGNVGTTSAVGNYPAGKTPDGVFDLAGNVWEWCADWYGLYGPEALTDPTGPPEGRARVVRGGSFILSPIHLRAASRGSFDPVGAGDLVGFRCVRSSPGGPSEA